MRRSSTFVMIAAIALTLGVACKKSGKMQGAAGSAMEAFPKETVVVGGISIAKLKGTKLWTEMDKAAAGQKAKLDEFKATCGIDPMNDLESIVVASTSLEDDKKILVAVKGKWDEAKLEKCITEMAKKDGKTVEVKKDGKVTEFVQGGDSFYATWPSGDTAIFGPDKALVADVAAKKSSLKDNAALAGMLGKVDTGATLWGAGLIPQTGDAAQMTAALGTSEKPEGAYATFKYGKDLDATVGIRFPSDKGAKEMADKANKELEGVKGNPMAGEYLKTLKVAASGKDTVVTLSLTEAQLDQIVGMLKSQLPMLMMMGGMGGGMGGDMGGDMGGGGMEPPAGDDEGAAPAGE